MPPEQTVNPLFQMVPFIFVLLIFYFIVIQPEKKKQAERKEKLSQLKKNDHVVTVGGVHGTVINVKQDTVIIRIDDNVKIEVDREAIVTIKGSS